MKNNVTRLLEGRKIPYRAYELPAEKLSALQVAKILSVPPEQVYKTIVATRVRRGKPILALIPGPGQVDLKALAKHLGEKKVQLATEREAEQLTGLKAGGISPLALINRGFNIIVDSSAQRFKEIIISGGRRGLDIRLPVSAFISLTGASVGEISHNAENTGN